MATIKIVVKKKGTNSNKHPVYLRVTKDRQCKYYKTPYTATEDEWVPINEVFSKRNPNYMQNNRLLVKFKERAYKVLTELEIENPDYSLQDFDKRYRISFNPVKNNVFAFFDEIIEEMTFAGRIGNAKSYKDAKNLSANFS